MVMESLHVICSQMVRRHECSQMVRRLEKTPRRHTVPTLTKSDVIIFQEMDSRIGAHV